LAAKLEQGVLELNWGANVAQVLQRYPAAREFPANSLMGMVAPAGFQGVRSAMGDIFILHVDPLAGLDAADFQVAANGVHQIVGTLDSGLSAGRSATARSMFGTFEHVHEWSAPGFGAVVSYSTADGLSTSPPIGLGSVRVQRGSLVVSGIQELLKPVLPATAPTR
jgi:hypothetical protein